MQGAKMGSLRLHGRVGSVKQLLLKLNGNQGAAWLGYQFRIQLTAQYQVRMTSTSGKWREIQVVCDQPETSASSVFFVNLLALDVGCLFSRGCHRLRISLRLLLVDFFLKY